MDTTTAETFCKPGWHKLTMYVPKDHPRYPYYFATIMTAATKGKQVYTGNISKYDGTEPCDITKTGYGLVLMN